MMEQVSGGTLTKDEALKKALDHANLDKDQVAYIKKVELDYAHGRKVYEITFFKGGCSVGTAAGFCYAAP